MTILQVDANSAYLSWTAAALLEQGYPVDIRQIPAVIAGDPNNRHGIILAKSIPAKKRGVKTGCSLMEAKEACPELLIFPPDYDLFLACSDAMQDILSEYTPRIQRYSIDESFLDYRRSALHPLSPVDAAFEIRDRIRRELGFTVNVGVAPNKVLAKMACELEKPDRVHTVLTESEMREKIWPLPVSELFMVGRSTTRRLKRININTIGDLAQADPGMLQALLKSHGKLIWNYANGIDHDPVTTSDALLRKSVGNGMTMPGDVDTAEEADLYLLSLCERVGMRLRRHGLKSSLIAVGICSSGFFYYTHQLQLPFYTDDTTTIYRLASRLFRECWKHEPLRKLSVRAGGLIDRKGYQLSIFDIDSLKKSEALNRAVDRIRGRFGPRAIERGCFANTPYDPIEGGVNDGNYLMMGGYRQ